MNHGFILTGGPGSGKTTLLDALAAQGWDVRPEAGRAVIQEQVALDSDALPWRDPAAFARLMFARDLRTYRAAQTAISPVIFDRSLPDTIGYLKLCRLPVPEDMMVLAHAYRCNRRVFIAPPWQEIFANDSERKQTFAEAEATHHAMTETYIAFGYSLVTLPRAGVEARVQFFLDEMRGALA